MPIVERRARVSDGEFWVPSCDSTEAFAVWNEARNARGLKEMASFVQYVVVRGDLTKRLSWPLGAVIAQACHATSAVTHLFRDDPNTQAYVAHLDDMHKIVLEANDEASLLELAAELKKNDVDHKLWIEQPENFATCLVSKPYKKEEVQKYFKKFKLLK